MRACDRLPGCCVLRVYALIYVYISKLQVPFNRRTRDLTVPVWPRGVVLDVSSIADQLPPPPPSSLPLALLSQMVMFTCKPLSPE